MKFFQLGPGEQAVWLKTWLWVWGVRIGLWVLPFRVFKGLFKSRMQRMKPRDRTNWEEVFGITHRVERVSACVVKAKCLVKAYAAQVLLAEAGYGSCLRLGVAKNQEKGFVAHAWVEVEKEVVIGGQGLEQYTPLPDMDSLEKGGW